MRHGGVQVAITPDSAGRASVVHALSRRLRPALMAFFRRRLGGDQAHSEDLTQEVFVRLMDLPARTIDNPEAYVFQIAANLLTDEARRQRHRDNHSRALREDATLGLDPLSPERIAAAREQIGAVARLLDTLPERTRTIFILLRLEAMSRQTVADTFGISPSAVDKHLRKALMVVLGAQGNSDDD